ncbi:hypothetical protein [Mesorhizobium huakuii]|uniref:hypothetical protein n=1 Tax=Mesorhizobium huakuii TaxID=28104 RepID=UPI0024E07C29|nr:hypothetical protein [Mesorhizobium huakuii]
MTDDGPTQNCHSICFRFHTVMVRRFERPTPTLARTVRPGCCAKEQVKMVALPSNHFNLRCQIAQISRPTKRSFLRPQVLMVASSRNRSLPVSAWSRNFVDVVVKPILHWSSGDFADRN